VALVSPDIVRYVHEFAFGEIYSRPGLDPRSRSIATIAALTAMSHAPIELKPHIHGALNVGVTREEIIEVIIQMSLYAGIPASMNAMLIAGEVFSEREMAE
jgi:4-carboxymuconolactone decarboxylase